MNVTFLTNEYPPHVYGGAGVHVEHLSRELSKLGREEITIRVLCFGDQKEGTATISAQGVEVPPSLPVRGTRHEKLLDALFRDIMMVSVMEETDLVHCHTWYTHLAGCLIKELYSCPLVLTTHSLEPHRPWKKEQLGAGYAVSEWLEKTAYQNADGVIAVSKPMKQAVKELYGVPPEKVRVIPNGIDTDVYKPTHDPALLTSYRIDPSKPYVLFVGRITRQKGIIHLVNAIRHLAPGIQVVLCAGAPDSPEIRGQMEESVDAARSQTKNEIVWIHQWIPRDQIVTLYTHASAFVCPSVYEPFGIINLEAMACGTPVVASAVGGIPEVVIPGETGLLVSFDTAAGNDWEPNDPEQFSKDLAGAVNNLLGSPEKLNFMGARCREWVEEHFSWKSVARDTFRFYQELTGKG